MFLLALSYNPLSIPYGCGGGEGGLIGFCQQTAKKSAWFPPKGWGAKPPQVGGLKPEKPASETEKSPFFKMCATTKYTCLVINILK